MNNQIAQQHHETEVLCTDSTSRAITWICPHCQNEQQSSSYGRYNCLCEVHFDVRKQPYESKTKAYVVMLSRQAQRRPAEVK